MRILGGGSNVVVADQGVPGVVVHLGNLNRMQREGQRVTVGGGVTMAIEEAVANQPIRLIPEIIVRPSCS